MCVEQVCNVHTQSYMYTYNACTLEIIYILINWSIDNIICIRVHTHSLHINVHVQCSSWYGGVLWYL